MESIETLIAKRSLLETIADGIDQRSAWAGVVHSLIEPYATGCSLVNYSFMFESQRIERIILQNAVASALAEIDRRLAAMADARDPGIRPMGLPGYIEQG